jgi:RNA polymerase sigma-70 factor (ECF subfamily)
MSSLAVPFLSALGRHAGACDPATLEAALAKLVRDGQAAWPGVRVDPARYVAHVAHAIADVARGPTLAGQLGALHAGDLFLAFACAHGDAAAHAALDRHFLGAVDRYVASVDTSPAFAAEVRQKMREELLVAPREAGAPPKIAAYGGRGPLGGWLRVVAVRRALNLRRGKADDLVLDPDAGGGIASARPDPELDYLKALYRQEFKDAFASALQRLAPEERNALRVHHLDGLTLDETAVVCRVSRATVARWLAGARARILADTQKLLRDRLKVDETTMQSILRLVQSQLDVSLHAYLGESGRD